MNWILDHFQIVVAIAAALAAWLTQRSKGGGIDGEGEDPPSTVTGEDDQTRRIQEEIRRKIAERRGQAAPEEWAPPADTSPRTQVPPVMAPRPLAREISPSLRDRLEAKLAQARAREEAAARNRSLALQEQTRKFESEEAAALKSENEAHHLQVLAGRAAESAAAVTAANVRSAWLNQLRQPQQVRRAIVLREILGPPVGLQ
jgi:hypothetical protein